MQMIFVQAGGAGCVVSFHCPFVLHMPQRLHISCTNLWEVPVQGGLESVLIWCQFCQKELNFPETSKAREQQVLQKVTFLLRNLLVCLIIQVYSKGVNSGFLRNFIMCVRKGNYFCLIKSGICVIIVELFQAKIMILKQNIWRGQWICLRIPPPST